MNHKSKLPRKAFTITFVVALLLICCIGYFIFKPKVVNTIILEAGSPMVDISEFLRNKNTVGTFVTDVDSLDLNKPGTYMIEILIGKKIHTSRLIIEDNEAPTGVPADVLILKGENVKAEAFVTDISDATEVSVSFSRKPNTRRTGKQTVEIVLEDEGRNKTVLTANLTVLEVMKSVQVEAGSEMSLTTQDFVDHGDWPVSFVTNINDLDISKPTRYDVILDINGRRIESVIEVVDTTPPSATVTDQEIYLGQTIEADAFVSDIVDVSEVSCSFLKKPPFNKEGTKQVVIVLTDSYGNNSQYSANLVIREDTDPPVFTGIKDIVIYEGQAVSYKKDIQAVDAKDGEVDFQVDSSKVNTNKPGTYEVIYTAVDEAGNKAVEKAVLTVKKLVVSEEAVYALADEILERITKPEMSKREIAYEIYKYVKRHVAYTKTSDKTNVIKEAYRGIKYGVGDCFTYYALSEVLLTRAGIDNMRVTRVGGKTQHFWNLINCGDGWYHYDSTPHKDGAETFMLTDAEVEAYTKKVGRNYYTFDKSKYPATPEN
jgi:transglutaminase-like putative cysteine protease